MPHKCESHADNNDTFTQNSQTAATVSAKSRLTDLEGIIADGTLALNGTLLGGSTIWACSC